MNKCFLICLHVLILQSVHEQFVNLNGTKSMEEITRLEILAELYVLREFPALALVKFFLTLISSAFLVFNRNLVRFPWKDLVCRFLAKRSACGWV